MVSSIIKLLLDDKEYSQKLSKTKKEISSFGSIGSSAFNSVAGVVGKFAGAIGLAAGAYEGFNKVINSSQTLADNWAITIDAAKTTIDNFFYSISNGDFSPFIDGLDSVISRAKEAAAAVDDLGNVQMSYGYTYAKNMALYQEALNRARDESLSSKERSRALEQAKLYSSEMIANAKEYKTTATNTVAKQLAARGGFDYSLATPELIDEALSLDIKANRDILRAEMQKDYEEYRRKLAAAEKTHEKVTNFNPTTGTTYTSSVPLEEFKGMSDEEIDNVVAARVKELQQQYQRVVVLFTALEMYTDETLGQAGNLITATNNAVRSAESTVKAIQRAEKSIKSSSTSIPPVEETKITPIDTSISKEALNTYFPEALPEKIEAIDIPLPEAISDKAVSIIEEETKALTTLSGAFNTLGSAVQGTEGSFISWIASVAQASANVSQLVVSIQKEVAAHRAKASATGADTASTLANTAAGGANTAGSALLATAIGVEADARQTNANAAATEASAKAMSAHAGIPFAGVAMGVAAVATIIATLAAIPKFAAGGVVTGPTVGLIGEAGPEAVIPLNKLEGMLNGGAREVRVVGTLRARGKDLVGTIDNYNAIKNVK